MPNYIDNNKSYTKELVRLSKNNLVAIGYEKLVVNGATAQSLQSIPDEAKYMEIALESDITTTIPIRYLMLGDLTPPTTTDGLPLRDGTFLDVTGRPNIDNFRVIESTNGTHTLHIQYYK